MVAGNFSNKNERAEVEKIDRLRRAMYSRSLSPKLKDRDRRELSLEREVVGDDWKRPEPDLAPSLIAPATIGVVRSIVWWVLGIAMVFFIGAVAFFVYYFTVGAGSTNASPANIDIAVSGPPQVQGGMPTELQISITNRNSVPLQLVSLVVTFPNGTRKVDDFLSPLTRLRQDLGAIDPGVTKQGTISAVFSGAQGTHENVKVEIEYRINGSNAIFTAGSDYAINFSSSPLTIAVDGNTQTISGQPTSLTITITSNTESVVRDAMLTVDYPFGFKFSSATPAPFLGSAWELGDVAPGDRRTIILSGTLSGETGDDRIFNITAGTRKDATSTVIATAFAHDPFHVAITQPFLNLTITTNGASGKSAVIRPGEPVTVTIAYQNNITRAITNAVIAARLSGITIDGTTVRSADGFYRSSDETMYWDRTTTSGVLSNLEPGAKGTVAFSFQMPSSEELAKLSNPYLSIAINAAGNRISEKNVPENLQSTVQQKIAIATDLQLSAQGLYYANPYGSQGSLPPKANVETTYALVFTIRNTTGKITGATLTATLPPYVRWTGKKSPSYENVSFNNTDSTVTWSIGDIVSGLGIASSTPRQMAFEIGFTPSTSQIGQQPQLLRNISLTGIDSSTGRKITKKLQDVTTNLIQVSRSADNVPIGVDTGFVPEDANVVK